MLLDTGILILYTLTNTADEGDKPSYALTQQSRQYYGERMISYSRQYAAKGVDEQIDLLVRIWRDCARPKIGWYAVTEDDSNQYRIDNVQPGYDEDGLPIYDLSLSAMEKHYDIVT